MNSEIELAYQNIKSTIPNGVTLVAVSKTKPLNLIQEVYQQGQRVFGENRVQELVEKYESLPKDIKWHLIGHLQRNKVKYIASFVDMIHSIDSERLLDEVNNSAKKHNRKINVLLQFHIAQEETKFGLSREEAKELIENNAFQSCQNIRVVGVMGMASFVEDEEQVHREFQSLKSIFDHLKASNFKDNAYFKEISMGMSGDYQIAIEEGSTMIRVGSSVFGGR